MNNKVRGLADAEQEALSGLLHNLEHEAGDVDDLAPSIDINEDMYWAYHSYHAIKKLMNQALAAPADGAEVVWHDISSAPQGLSILVCTAHGSVFSAYRDFRGVLRADYSQEPFIDTVTHWTSFPKPPKAEDRAATPEVDRG